MLQSMRDLAQSGVVKGLMLILMVSFCLWGIGDIFRGNPLEKTVAKAGNTSISVQELNHLFEETLAQARQRMPEMSVVQARQMGLLDKTLDNAVTRALVDQDIKRMGIEVQPQEVLKLVADQPQFRMKDGSFNKALFQQLLQQQRMTESTFIAQGQQDLSRQVVLGALTGTHTVSQTMIDALYKARAQQRILDVVTIDAAKMTGVVTPDDKELHDFYGMNSPLFTAPEYRGVTIAVFSTDDMAKDIQISDEQVEKEYTDKSEQLSHPEQRDIVQVVVQDEAKAKQLVTDARSAASLVNAAKADKETAIPLDQLTEKDLMPELSKVVFALKAGDVSDPVKTQLGWHVVQVKKITPAGKPELSAIKDKLREDMRRDQSIEAATRAVNQLDDQLAAGHSLDDIADGLKLRLIKIPALDATGLTPDGKAPSELPNKEQMIKDAFAQNSGETSPIEDDKAGHYYVVRTDEIIPSAAKPFDSVKADVIAAWKTHEQVGKAQILAKSISKDLEAGKLLSSFTGQEGVSVRSSLPLSQMGDTDPLLPPSIVTQAFKLKLGQIATAMDSGKEVIARVASVTDVDTTKVDPRKNKIEGEVRQAVNNELLEQYIQHLHQIFKVKVDTALLDKLRQQDN